MQNKLQELTDKLYSEGLSKGQKEAQEIVSKAKEEANQIVENAKKEYDSILEKAKKEAADYKLKIENELKMVSRQSIATIKQQIEESLLKNILSKPINNAMVDSDFIKTLLKSAIESFNPKDEAIKLEVLLPEELKNKLDEAYFNDIKKEFSVGLDISFSKKIGSGFKIGNKNDGYFISFTDTDFEELFSAYLKPKSKELIFGE